METKNTKLTKLPEKWSVNVTDSNLQIINKWLGEHRFNLGRWSCVNYNKSATDIIHKDSRLTTISFEDFERLVLNKPSKINWLWKLKIN